jgi:hypothetical protein
MNNLFIILALLTIFNSGVGRSTKLCTRSVCSPNYACSNHISGQPGVCLPTVIKEYVDTKENDPAFWEDPRKLSGFCVFWFLEDYTSGTLDSEQIADGCDGCINQCAYDIDACPESADFCILGSWEGLNDNCDRPHDKSAKY